MKCKLYTDTKRKAKSGSEYWARKYEGEVEYVKRKGDFVNKKHNIQRQLDSNTIQIFMPIHDEEIQDSEEQTIFSEEQEIGRSLCGAINAVLEIKGATILSTSIKENSFIIKYSLKGKEKEIKQPLS